MITEYIKTSGNKFVYKNEEIFLKGISDYGAFSLGYDYKKFIPVIKPYGINILREWACPYPADWGGIQPFTDVNKGTLNQEFFKNADRFINLARTNDIFVLVDLLDRVGLSAAYFGSHPYNVKNGGFLKAGLPDAYDHIKTVNNMVKVAKRLSKHKNVVFQLINEPAGFRTNEALIHTHKDIIEDIRANGIENPIIVNTIPNNNGMPVIPNPKKVGAVGFSVHGGGIRNPRNADSCKFESIKAYLKQIINVLDFPMLVDMDGLWNDRLPGYRGNPDVLTACARAAKECGAGIIQRANEPIDDSSKIDFDSLNVLKEV